MLKKETPCSNFEHGVLFMFLSDIENVSEKEICGVEKAGDMCSFHSVAAINRHSESSCAKVVSRSYSSGCVGSVMIINIHFVIATGFFGITDKAVGKFVIIGSGGVFSANGNGIFVAVITRSDKADIDGYVFGNFRRNIGAAHSDLFGIREGKNGSVFRFKVVFGKIFEHCENAGDSAFVIDEAGFDISVFGYLAAGFNGNEIAVADSESFYVLFGGNFFVKDYHHGVFVAGKSSCVIENVDGMALAGHKTGVFFSASGVDGNGFAFIAAVIDSAKLTDADHSVFIDCADDHSEGIGMCADENGFGIVFAFKSDICGALVIVSYLLAEFCGIFFEKRVHFYVIANGAGGVYDIFKTIDYKFCVNVKFHMRYLAFVPARKLSCGDKTIISLFTEVSSGKNATNPAKVFIPYGKLSKCTE